MDEKYEEIRKDVVIKGFRPGKVPKDLIKRQFGKAIYGGTTKGALREH